MELFVEPRVIKSWSVFLKENPEYSIALDGYVSAGPMFDHDSRKVNFDHHTGVDRLATRSTAGQVYVAIKQGLFDTFRRNGRAYANIFVNDADQDVSVSAWLLLNHRRLAGTASGGPAVTRLVNFTDLMDATGGTFPVSPEAEIMEERAWIFEPYLQARHQGALQRMDSAAMRSVISDVGRRIDDYVAGRGKRLPIDTRYTELGGGNDWIMVEEVGFEARNAIFAQGNTAFVSVKKKDSSWTYTLAKMSQFIPFPIARLYEVLNERECLNPAESNRWGGSELIGGSPRETGSLISPDELETIINDTIRSLDAPVNSAILS